MRRPGSWWDGAVERPSANEAGHIPSWRGSCECYALSPIAAGRRWSLVLLSPLRSSQLKPSGGKPTWTAASTRDRGREAARQHELLFGLGQYGVDADLIFCQPGTLGRVGLRLAAGLRLAPGVFAVAGHGSLVLGVGVPHCLPDSPDEVFELTSRDVEPDPPVWVDPVPLQNVVRRLTCRFSGSAHAARWYSLITPPRIFRRCTGASSGTTTGAS